MPGDEYGNWKELADDLMPDFSGLFEEEIATSNFINDPVSSSPASGDNRRTDRMIILASVLGHSIEFTCM